MTRRRLAFLPALSLALLTGACASEQPGWRQAGGPLHNVSGMAYVGIDPERGGEQFLVVHDNKKPAEPHAGIVTLRTGKARYTRLRWPEAAGVPVDLEAISPVPDAPGRFLALESGGRLFHVRFATGDAFEVLNRSKLPEVPDGANFEGLAVQKLGGRLVIVWGHRGDGKKEPGVLHWGTYDLPDDAVTKQGSASVLVPFPRGKNTRHITDLRIDPGGTVWAGAASDPGDDGPFESAVYAIGALADDGGGNFRFQPNASPTRLWKFRRKVEALELVPGRRGGVYFGSDDEKGGGWVYRAP